MNGTASIVNITFVNGEESPNPTNIITGLTSSYAGYNYVVFETPEIGATAAYGSIDLSSEQIKFPKSVDNDIILTIVNNSVVPTDTPVQLAAKLGFVGNHHFAYQISENVTYETLNNVTMMYNIGKQNYLQMYIDLDGNLSGKFMDSGFIALESIDTQANYTIDVQ